MHIYTVENRGDDAVAVSFSLDAYVNYILLLLFLFRLVNTVLHTVTNLGLQTHLVFHTGLQIYIYKSR
jgi:hypothetical protein